MGVEDAGTALTPELHRLLDEYDAIMDHSVDNDDASFRIHNAGGPLMEDHLMVDKQAVITQLESLVRLREEELRWATAYAVGLREIEEIYERNVREARALLRTLQAPDMVIGTEHEIITRSSAVSMLVEAAQRAHDFLGGMAVGILERHSTFENEGYDVYEGLDCALQDLRDTLQAANVSASRLGSGSPTIS